MKLNKTELSWILYDVANSAFILIVTATIPIYFRSLASNAGVADHTISAWFGGATSTAVIILAFLSPILGAIADYKGMKKKMFLGFLGVGILGALTMTIMQDWLAFLFLFVLARIGYSACNIFYDSMLVDVAEDDRMDMLSSMGYAFGYIGSTIPFIIGIVIIFTKPFGISTTMATQISFVITVIWWALLSIPLLKNVKQKYYLPPINNVVKTSFARVFKTLAKIRQDKRMFYFIVGYFFYIDGVYTIISMATTYGGEVGIDSTLMIVALLLTQIIAFPFAILAGMLAKKYGPIRLIKIYILIYIFIAIFGFQLDKAWEFWFLAVMVALAQGGVQSLSRSYFGKIVPKNESNEYFGFFDIFGKFADFFGPLILTAAALIFQSSRYGILALIILFIIGYWMVDKVHKIDTANAK